MKRLRFPLTAFLLLFATDAWAEPTLTQTGLKAAGGSAGFGTNSSPATVVAAIVNGVLGLSGLIFVVMIVWGGVQYLIAQGDPDRVKNAKATMTWSVVGLIAILAAYAVTTFLFTTLGAALSTPAA